MSSHHRRISGDLSLGRISCDFFVILCLAVPLLIFHEWVTPYKRGFYCDDESIRYPYRPSTVSRQMLIVIGIMIPTLLIMGAELLRSLVWERQCPEEFGIYRYKKVNVHRLIVRLYVFIGYFLLGICFNQLMVDIAKYTIGRHRPHFMDVCKPATKLPTRGPSDDVTRMVVKEFRTNCPPDEHTYVTDFECLGENKYLIHESMLSFYSGHAAFSVLCCMVHSVVSASASVSPADQQAGVAGGPIFAVRRRRFCRVQSVGTAIGLINAIFIAELFHRREMPTEYRAKRRLFGKYTQVPPSATAAATGDYQRGETEEEPANNHHLHQLDTVRIVNDGPPHGGDTMQQQQQQQQHRQPQIRMVPIRRQFPADEAGRGRDELSPNNAVTSSKF
uniref:Phosphatidic acid phosphatase type 2/haloperoxidase domain-containing protein n=1 Tax=Globodera rostochiensis TaxID=31243 RepID=A0A914I1P9_GLORO